MKTPGETGKLSACKDMKNSEVSDNKFYEYIKNNRDCDPARLRLDAHGRDLGFSTDLAITQIECRQKTRRKLSLFNSFEKFIYPSALSAEQATHQSVAAYHAELAGNGLKILDMTAGLGIDAFTLAREGNMVTAIELDSGRAKALRHNATVVNTKDVEIIEGDSIEWISQNSATRHFDLLFIDPARRDTDNRRTYFLKDCEPDVTRHIGNMFQIADRIMIKCSPILDITDTVRTLPGIEELHIVCVKGECKEVLVIISSAKAGNATKGKPMITVADIAGTQDGKFTVISRFEHRPGEPEVDAEITDANEITVGKYLYDPNAGIHKLNCARALCSKFEGLKKIAPNTDLYISDTLFVKFPGRTYIITGKIEKADMKKLKGIRRDVAVRNYPLTADELRKKIKAKSDPDKYIYGFRGGHKNEPLLIDCKKTAIQSKEKAE